jgi:hypothetical protein
MCTLSDYDRACLGEHLEFVRLFQNVAVINVLGWKQELCHEHLRRFPTSASGANFLEYEARLGRYSGTHFDSSISEHDFKQLHQLVSTSEWFKPLDSDVVLTQDMYYKNKLYPDGICRTRLRYFKSLQKAGCPPIERVHIFKRKLISVIVEPRRPQTTDTTLTDPLAIRIDMNQEIPLQMDETPDRISGPHISMNNTQVVQITQTRFKWTDTFEYKSPKSGLVWHYHFHRVLEGKNKCDAEQKSKQLLRFLRYECECECMNFLTVYDSTFAIRITPIVYLFGSFLTKLNDFIKILLEKTHQNSETSLTYLYECVQARVFIANLDQLYVPFK